MRAVVASLAIAFILLGRGVALAQAPPNWDYDVTVTGGGCIGGNKLPVGERVRLCNAKMQAQADAARLAEQRATAESREHELSDQARLNAVAAQAQAHPSPRLVEYEQLRTPQVRAQGRAMGALACRLRTDEWLHWVVLGLSLKYETRANYLHLSGSESAAATSFLESILDNSERSFVGKRMTGCASNSRALADLDQIAYETSQRYPQM